MTAKSQLRKREPGMVTLYSAIWPDLAVIAREHGYALSIHGSLACDLDLIAVPWTDSAASPDDLVESICQKIKSWHGDPERGTWGDKPHGRRVYTIILGGHAYIDLSVMPRAGNA